MVEPIALECNGELHWFEKDLIEKWRNSFGICPRCNRTVESKEQHVKSDIILNSIDDLRQKMAKYGYIVLKDELQEDWQRTSEEWGINHK